MSASKRWIGAAAALLLLSGPARAQQQQQQPDAQAQPGDEQAQPGDEQAQPGEPASTERGNQIATGPGFREIEGNVANVSPLVNDLKVVDPSTGRILDLDVSGDTTIVRGGEPIDLEDIREGAEVRASYVLRGDNLVAERIEVGERDTKPAETVKPGAGDVSPTLRVQGRVTDKSDLWNNFKLVDPERNLAINLDVEGPTAFTLEGKRVTFQTLEPGMEVRATYRLKNDEFVAEQVEILREPSFAPEGPAESEQQPGPQQPEGVEQPPPPSQPQQPAGAEQPAQPQQPGQPQTEP